MIRFLFKNSKPELTLTVDSTVTLCIDEERVLREAREAAKEAHIRKAVDNLIDPLIKDPRTTLFDPLSDHGYRRCVEEIKAGLIRKLRQEIHE